MPSLIRTVTEIAEGHYRLAYGDNEYHVRKRDNGWTVNMPWGRVVTGITEIHDAFGLCDEYERARKKPHAIGGKVAKRPRRRIDLRMDADLADHVDTWCSAQPTKTTRTAAVEAALRAFLGANPIE